MKIGGHWRCHTHCKCVSGRRTDINNSSSTARVILLSWKVLKHKAYCKAMHYFYTARKFASLLLLHLLHHTNKNLFPACARRSTVLLCICMTPTWSWKGNTAHKMFLTLERHLMSWQRSISVWSTTVWKVAMRRLQYIDSYKWLHFKIMFTALFAMSPAKCVLVLYAIIVRTSDGARFLAERTNGRDYATVLHLSVCCPSLTSCVVAKRCVLEQQLLLTSYRQSHVGNWLVSKWMTFLQRFVTFMSTISSHSLKSSLTVASFHRPPAGSGLWGSNGHLIDDVTWPWKVKLVNLICLRAQYVRNSWRCHLAKIANY